MFLFIFFFSKAESLDKCMKMLSVSIQFELFELLNLSFGRLVDLVDKRKIFEARRSGLFFLQKQKKVPEKSIVWLQIKTNYVKTWMQLQEKAKLFDVLTSRWSQKY